MKVEKGIDNAGGQTAGDFSQLPSTGTFRRYPYHAAGRIWTIPEVTIEEDFAGHPVLPAREITRITQAIANEICGTLEPLTAIELEFLCGITGTKYVEVARRVGVTKAAVSIWLRSGGRVPILMSHVLKKWFWFRIFGESLKDTMVFRGTEAFDDGEFLHHIRQEAIDHALAEPLREAS